MIKVLLSLMAISLSTLFTSAQITKGSVLLGGGLGIGNTKSESENNNELKNSNFNVNFSAGTAFKENYIFGGSINYGQVIQKHINNNNNNALTRYENSNYGAGIFLRRYVSLGKKFYLFGQGGLNYNHNETFQLSGTDSQSDSKGWTIGVNIAPGISYALTRKFHLELGFNELAGISYGKSKTKNTFLGGSSISNNSSFGFNTSLGTSTPFIIGFRVLLAK